MSSTIQSTFCVGTYLTTRLKQIGVNQIFSVPGDYTSDFLEIVDTRSDLQRIGNCNELNAAYAADGYARVNGVGAVAITTGVGAFSTLTAIGGSYVEKIPVVLVIGTLSNTKLLTEINTGELFHHQVNTQDFNKKIFDQVTVAFERITNPLNAPAQIDAAILACLTESRPVGIEIMEDCYYMPCAAPVGNIVSIDRYEPLDVLKQMAALTPPNVYAKQIVTAVNNAAQQIYNLMAASRKPIFWVGKEFSTNYIQYLFTALQEQTNIPYVSSLLGKAVFSEDDPWFLGMYNGVFTSPVTKAAMANCDCLIGLGVWNTDLNNFGTATQAPGNPSTIFASRDMVKIGEDIYIQVSLENVLKTLMDLLTINPITPVWTQPTPPQPPALPNPANDITYDGFFTVLSSNLTPSDQVVAEIGLSSFGGSSFLQINRANGFLSQFIWAAIGWSVPAGLGASYINQTRTMIIVGDGAFKLTCQEISTMVKENRNIVIFVLNNNVYAVEQILLNPAPFKNPSAPYEAANVLQRWDYVSLLKGFSNNSPNAMSANVDTVQDFMNTMTAINNNPNALWLVNINLSDRDFPVAWLPFVNK